MDVLDFNEMNEELIAQGQTACRGEAGNAWYPLRHLLQQVPSYQQHPSRRPQKVLTEALLMVKVDHLIGIKGGT